MRDAAAAFALATLAAAPQAMAQPPMQQMQHPHAMMAHGTMLTVTAEAEIAEAPDMARINTGVESRAATASQAAADNAAKMSQVIAALKRMGVREADIQTSSLSLNAEMQYRDNEAPKVTGYRAANDVRISTKDLKNLGRVIDAAIAAGANQINGISFEVDDQDQALDKARAQAVKKARARAELYAQAAGLKVGRICAIHEGGAAAPPMPFAMDRMVKAAATPIQPGQVEMTVQVTMVFELE